MPYHVYVSLRRRVSSATKFNVLSLEDEERALNSPFLLTLGSERGYLPEEDGGRSAW